MAFLLVSGRVSAEMSKPGVARQEFPIETKMQLALVSMLDIQ
jgi:hypothetical protein